MSKTDLLMFLHTSAPISKQCLPSCSGGHLGVIFLLSLPPYTATVSSTSAVSAEVLFSLRHLPPSWHHLPQEIYLPAHCSLSSALAPTVPLPQRLRGSFKTVKQISSPLAQAPAFLVSLLISSVSFP